MKVDVTIIGAGASGLMCAYKLIHSGLDVLLIDHEKNFAKKLLISGGGKCNFSNSNMDPSHYISSNTHFVKSALARFKPSDFIRILDKHHISYFKKDNGEYFLKESSEDILNLFKSELSKSSIKLKTSKVTSITKNGNFIIKTNSKTIESKNLIIATGGLSYPNLGASNFGYKIAKQFLHNVTPLRPALVPFLFTESDNKIFSKLAGISFETKISLGKFTFDGSCLFTHKGLSGPAALKCSSYWEIGQNISLDLLPNIKIFDELENLRQSGSKDTLMKYLMTYLPNRLAKILCEHFFESKLINSYSIKELRKLDTQLHSFLITPKDTEGYNTAEVTRGGIDTNDISSKTMESKLSKNLYFIGEVLDVTGDLGGYNLHFAWASANASCKSILESLLTK